MTITYFVSDEKKDGGKYVSYTGVVKKINAYERTLIMKDALTIPIKDIREIADGSFDDFLD